MLIVTIAALVMAASLGWFAYRLMQEEQRRSEARVALLAAALDESPSIASAPPAAVPAAAWRQDARADRADRLDSLRVAPPPLARHQGVPEVVMLDDDSRQIRQFASETRHDQAPVIVEAPRVEPAAAPEASTTAIPATARVPETARHLTGRTTTDVPDGIPARADGLFADVPTARAGDARGLIVVVALLLVGLLAAGYAWMAPGAATADVPASVPAATTAATGETEGVVAPGGIPLELVSLAHERRGGTLVVRGVVRNPVAGSARAELSASVLLLDQAGGFLRSGRAALPATSLAPGAETAFTVTLPSTDDVRRYRVTFRDADGALVPHADRRN